jgi:iron complex outermembrane receptor protein
MARHPRFRHARSSAILIAVSFTFTPSLGHTDELVTPSPLAINDELQLLKEEESVSMVPEDRQPILPGSSKLYVMTDEDIRESGAADLPTLLRRILGFDVPEVTGSEINRSARVDNQLIANRLLVVVDGRSIHVDTSDAVSWKNIPVTLSDIKRLEMWKESASAGHGINGYRLVIKIFTKTPGK